MRYRSSEKSRSPISGYRRQRVDDNQRGHGYMKNTMSSGGAPNKLTTEGEEYALPQEVSDAQQLEDVRSSVD